MWVRGAGGETVAQGSSIGDSSSSRIVYFIVVVLVLMAAGLLWFSLQYWRRTRPGSEAAFERAPRAARSARVPRAAGPRRADEGRGAGRSREYPEPDRPARRSAAAPRPSLFDDDAPAQVDQRRRTSADPRLDPRVEPRRERQAGQRSEPPARPRSTRRDDRRPPRRDDGDLTNLLEDDPNAYRRGTAIHRSSDPPRDPLL